MRKLSNRDCITRFHWLCCDARNRMKRREYGHLPILRKPRGERFVKLGPWAFYPQRLISKAFWQQTFVSCGSLEGLLLTPDSSAFDITCALCFHECFRPSSVLELRSSYPRAALLGSWSCARTTVQVAAAILESSGALTQATRTGSGEASTGTYHHPTSFL
jgi:hypothetical protein